MDLEREGIEPRSFDLVTMIDLIGGIPVGDPEKWLLKSEEILKDEGYLVVDESHGLNKITSYFKGIFPKNKLLAEGKRFGASRYDFPAVNRFYRVKKESRKNFSEDEIVDLLLEEIRKDFKKDKYRNVIADASLLEWFREGLAKEVQGEKHHYWEAALNNLGFRYVILQKDITERIVERVVQAARDLRVMAEARLKETVMLEESPKDQSYIDELAEEVMREFGWNISEEKVTPDFKEPLDHLELLKQKEIVQVSDKRSEPSSQPTASAERRATKNMQNKPNYKQRATRDERGETRI